MFNKKFLKLSSVSLLFVFNSVLSMNVPVLYDTLLRPERAPGSRFQLAVKAQTGFSTKAFDENECVANVLNIWNKDQNSLKMLEGFDPLSPIGQLRTLINANDDCVRGHFSVAGDLDMDFGFEFSPYLYFCNDFSISLHIPVYSMKLKNVSWCEQTQDVSADDLRVKEYLTNDFCNNVRNLGCLDICGWKRSGLGDIAAIFEWMRDFKQSKPLLKNVRLSARAGISLPTGKRVDEDKIFAFSFGGDGSTGLLVGTGMDLNLASNLQAGLDIQLWHRFGNIRDRRIKTHPCQTELLLLQKACAYKEFGLTQRFNLYLELFEFLKRFSFRAGYQHIKQGDDILYLSSNKFSDEVANTAESLQERTMHSLVLNLSYNFHRDKDSRDIHPYISLFLKLPFNGMRVAMQRTVGVVFSIDF